MRTLKLWVVDEDVILPKLAGGSDIDTYDKGGYKPITADHGKQPLSIIYGNHNNECSLNTYNMGKDRSIKYFMRFDIKHPHHVQKRTGDQNKENSMHCQDVRGISGYGDLPSYNHPVQGFEPYFLCNQVYGYTWPNNRKNYRERDRC